MKASMDIDIGGTFTDLFVDWMGKPYFTKTATTGYDLSIGFMRAIKDVASLIGITIEELLGATEIIRYSTTVAMNTLIQRKGPKLGLITTEGFEDTVVIGKGAQWTDGATFREMRNIARIKKPEPIIPREMTVGVKERIDSLGKVVRPLDEGDVKGKLQHLVDKGARGFVVNLLWSFLNPAHEQLVEEIIREEYPESYLGAMPVVLSSRVLPKRMEYQRAMAAILNAYLHSAMAEELRGMGDELQNLGYQKPMMMVHNTGGMAEVFRTQAIQTYNGGPVAGLVGSASVGKLHGYDNVVSTDMGGTSFDLGLIVAGSTRFYVFRPVIDRWMVDITMLETISIGAGAGSMAWINQALGKKLEVGPQSAGSMPGPACYDLGGTEPTVTDADVVLGYINPDYYHGGKMRLNKEIAKPMGIKPVEAAILIKKVIDGIMGDVIFRETVLRGFDPKNFVLFAYGGAGPTHCCGYGFHAGVPKIVTFPMSPVFCAFGSANMDIIHFYEQSKRVPLIAPMTKKYLTNFDLFNSVVRELQQRALKEIALEGLPTEAISFVLELDMKYGGLLDILRIASPRILLESENDAKEVYTAFEQEYSKVYSPFAINPEGGVDIENFAIKAIVPHPRVELPTYEEKGKTPPSSGLKGKRPVYWEEYGEFRDTPIYEQKVLECGNVVMGPAIIEAEDTTTVLPPGTMLTVSKYLSGEITRV
jgi:N-methylhydantoinase A/oxoprolinase/acetone carboxylase beta subunit